MGPRVKTRAIRPFSRIAEATAGHAMRDCLKNPRRATVTASVSATSGIRIRVKSQRPAQVARVSPA